MAGIWTFDACGCSLELGDHGEPVAFAGAPCERHAAASAADVAAECRGKELARLLAGTQIAPWGIDDDGVTHVGTIDVFSGQIAVLASSPPVSLEEFVAAVSSTASAEAGTGGSPS